MSEAQGHRFSTRWGLLLSVLGIAVGTGNIWRFPRIAAQNGSDVGAGAFLLAWVVCLLVWSLPLIVAEYALGQIARRGVVGAFARLGGVRWAWMGAFVGLVSTAIMFYYSVVTGWCAYYLGRALFLPLPQTAHDATAAWEAFQAGAFPLVFHGLMMGIGALSVRRGVAGIERLSRVLMPTLLLLIFAALLRSLALAGSGRGITYLFAIDWTQLGTPKVWLEALTQNAWDTGAGWGIILCYAAYMRTHDRVVENAVLTGVLNNLVSLVAAVTIFGTVFSVLGADLHRGEVLEIMRNSGPASTGLTFVWMPLLFAKMAFGRMFAIAFFLGLTFAAFTSLLSMIELATRVLVDAGVDRTRAVGWVFLVGFGLGVPSAVDLDVLSNQDFVWGVGLMLSGLFVALLAAKAGSHGDAWRFGQGWLWLLRFAVPVLAIVLLAWWLYLSATEYAPTTWWNPLDAFSVMTCIVQWSVAILVSFAIAGRLSRGA